MAMVMWHRLPRIRSNSPPRPWPPAGAVRSTRLGRRWSLWWRRPAGSSRRCPGKSGTRGLAMGSTVRRRPCGFHALWMMCEWSPFIISDPLYNSRSTNIIGASTSETVTRADPTLRPQEEDLWRAAVGAAAGAAAPDRAELVPRCGPQRCHI